MAAQKATEARAGMDSNIARYEDDRIARLREAAQNALLQDQGEMPRQKITRYKLAMKRPGMKALLGGNPLSDEEFNELEKYFRLSRERI